MEDGFSLSKSRVAIVGLGLMGGSLALALKGRCAALYGVDRDAEIVSLAATRGVVDIVSIDPGAILPMADVIVIATPVRAIMETLRVLPEIHPGPAIVLDLGSTKVQILRLMEALPERFDPIGGHPMCGKENSGLVHADPELFVGAPFAFAALERTSEHAKSLCVQLAEETAAIPLWIDAETHDLWTAATSHFPYLVANILAGCTSPEVAPLVGPGFRSTTRLAVSSQQMMLDILTTNRENVLASFAAFRQRLDTVESFIQQDNFEALGVELAGGAMRRQVLVPAGG